MIQNTTSIIIIAAVIIIAFAAYFLSKKYISYKKYKVGKRGEKKVTKILHQIAAKPKNQFQVIDDAYLPLYDKTTQVDHILIGRFGIAVVETKALNGEIYGNESDKNWVHIAGGNRNKFYNPLLQNKTHVDCIRHILNKQKIHRVRIDSLIVFSEKNAMLHIPKGMPVITLNLLKKYFRKPRYRQDEGIDVQAVYQALTDARVTDKDRIKKHNSNVRKMAKGKY